ncbi:MAG: T9SS type A sorting domain-containing protein [Saprospiraceae bacterium]|nr:T9SS type A sorting domain-containing protein [Saprospiraceae bacterium]
MFSFSSKVTPTTAGPTGRHVQEHKRGQPTIPMRVPMRSTSKCNLYLGVEDVVIPVISVVTSADPAGTCNPSSIVAPTFEATDNCLASAVSVTPTTAGPTGPACARTQTWTANYTDACTNAAVPVSVTYTWVEDVVIPVISVVTSADPAGTCNPSSIVAPTFEATDNCLASAVSVTPTTAGPTGPACARTQTWTANYTDACTNAAVAVSVTYTWTEDNLAPVLTVPTTGLNLGENPTVLPTVTSIIAASSVTDNCQATMSAIAGELVGDCDKSQVFTITATDACGNTDVETVTYTWSCLKAAIGDVVWHDLNADGQQSPGEPGIPGVQVNLYKGDGTQIGTTYTDVNGYYLFDFLYPGSYYLEFIDPTGYDKTFFDKGSDNTDSDVSGGNGPGTTATTYLVSGERDLTWNAGYYKCVPIGDLVWYDINTNDVWDSYENGINGLRVNLWRNHFGTWVIWDYQNTGHKPGTPSDDGYWKFCAPPGTYYVEVIMPPLGLVRTLPNIGDNEEIDSDLTNANGISTTDKFTVLSGQMRCDLGAGYYPQAIIGNLVWRDENENGIQDIGEARVPNVSVQAVEATTGAIISTTQTDAQGIYSLEGLEKKGYYLRFIPPAGFGPTVPHATLDDTDSDVDHSNGPNTTKVYYMQPASINENIDMGLAFGALPVDWLSVNAKRINKTHEISWSTAREVNVSYYVVERRMETDKDFAVIPGKVSAKGNTSQVSSYQLTDFDVEKSGIYVYRVKQVDFDGQHTYSRLVKVSHNGDTRIDMYPNPARGETNIQVVLSQDSEVKIELFDAVSKLVKVIRPSLVQKEGDEIYNANLQDVAAGVYNVVITIDGVATHKKLIRIE